MVTIPLPLPLPILMDGRPLRPEAEKCLQSVSLVGVGGSDDDDLDGPLNIISSIKLSSTEEYKHSQTDRWMAGGPGLTYFLLAPHFYRSL